MVLNHFPLLATSPLTILNIDAALFTLRVAGGDMELRERYELNREKNPFLGHIAVLRLSVQPGDRLSVIRQIFKEVDSDEYAEEEKREILVDLYSLAKSMTKRDPDDLAKVSQDKKRKKPKLPPGEFFA